MALRQAELLEDLASERGPAGRSGPAGPGPSPTRAGRAVPPEPAPPGDLPLVRPLTAQGGPYADEPETDGSLVRALVYAVPAALGGWALIGAAIWSLL